jgi:hypothetical protein
MAKHSTPTTVSIQNAPTVEDLFEKLGGFGRFQVLLLFLVMIFEVPSALIFFSPMFTGSNLILLMRILIIYSSNSKYSKGSHVYFVQG